MYMQQYGAPGGYYTTASAPPLGGAYGGVGGGTQVGAVSSAYYPQMQQGVYSNRGAYAMPTMHANPMFQTPRDIYAVATPSMVPSLVAPGAYGAYGQQPPGYAPWQPQQQQQQRLAMPELAPQQGVMHPPPMYGTPALAGTLPAGGPCMGMANGQVGLSGLAPVAQPGAAPEAQEPDPDEDPNRLPTFVKVRGLPAEHDPRIARRPKPKRRPTGVCCV